MQALVTFRSPRFRPVLPDECQVNPGCYGAELAFWLCFLEAKGKGLFGRQKASTAGAAPLLQALARVLQAEASVSAIEWSERPA
jgi:hypothetical protein